MFIPSSLACHTSIKHRLSGLAAAGLGDALLKQLSAQHKAAARNDDLMLQLLTCAGAITAVDAKFVVGVRLGGGAALACIASLLRLKPSTHKLLVPALTAMSALTRSAPNALYMHAKGHVPAIVCIIQAEPRAFETSQLAACILLNVLSANTDAATTSTADDAKEEASSAHVPVSASTVDACTAVVAKGGVKNILDLLVEWSRLDSK